MKKLGLTLAAGLMLAVAASESQAQVTIGNPYNGQGMMIGRNGLTSGGYGNGYGYSPNGYNNGYRAPGTNYYNSGYRAPGVVSPNGYYTNGNYRGYGASGYRYPMNNGRAYSYPGTTTYRRGLLGRVRAR